MKKTKKKKKSNAGRHLFDGKPLKLVLPKLEKAFKYGATDEQACQEAGISKTAFYRYQDEHPEFRERKELIKTSPSMKAKKTIFDRLDDPNWAAWHLVHKEKAEYSPRSEVDVTNRFPDFFKRLGNMSEDELNAEIAKHENKEPCKSAIEK